MRPAPDLLLQRRQVGGWQCQNRFGQHLGVTFSAIRFGIENGQIAVFVLSEGREVRVQLR